MFVCVCACVCVCASAGIHWADYRDYRDGSANKRLQGGGGRKAKGSSQTSPR